MQKAKQIEGSQTVLMTCSCRLTVEGVSRMVAIMYPGVPADKNALVTVSLPLLHRCAQISVFSLELRENVAVSPSTPSVFESGHHLSRRMAREH